MEIIHPQKMNYLRKKIRNLLLIKGKYGNYKKTLLIPDLRATSKSIEIGFSSNTSVRKSTRSGRLSKSGRTILSSLRCVLICFYALKYLWNYLTDMLATSYIHCSSFSTLSIYLLTWRYSVIEWVMGLECINLFLFK